MTTEEETYLTDQFNSIAKTFQDLAQISDENNKAMLKAFKSIADELKDLTDRIKRLEESLLVM